MTTSEPQPQTRWRPTKTQVLVGIAVLTGILALNLADPRYPWGGHLAATIAAALLGIVAYVTIVWAGMRTIRRERPVNLRKRLQKRAARRRKREGRAATE